MVLILFTLFAGCCCSPALRVNLPFGLFSLTPRDVCGRTLLVLQRIWGRGHRDGTSHPSGKNGPTSGGLVAWSRPVWVRPVSLNRPARSSGLTRKVHFQVLYCPPLSWSPPLLFMYSITLFMKRPRREHTRLHVYTLPYWISCASEAPCKARVFLCEVQPLTSPLRSLTLVRRPLGYQSSSQVWERFKTIWWSLEDCSPPRVWKLDVRVLGVKYRPSGVALISNSCPRRGQMAGCAVPALIRGGEILPETQLWGDLASPGSRLKRWVSSECDLLLGWNLCCSSGRTFRNMCCWVQ